MYCSHELTFQQCAPLSAGAASSCSVAASAPGKVILHGEHAVVYGSLALAAAVSERCRVTASWPSDGGGDCRSATGPVVLDFPALGMRGARLEAAELDAAFPVAKAALTVAADAPPFTEAELATINALSESVVARQRELEHRDLCQLAVSAFVAVYAWLKPPLLGNVEFLVSGRLPIGGGLGSSAAYVAALAAVCEAMSGRALPLDTAAVEAAAFAAEHLVHGRPSGVDTACAVRGGVIAFRRPGPPVPLLPPLPHCDGCHGDIGPDDRLSRALPHVYLADTGLPRSTGRLVAGVRLLADSAWLGAPVRHVIDAIGCVSESAQKLLVAMAGNDSVGAEEEDNYLALVRLNQRLLQCLGVSHESIDRLCVLAEARDGAVKLTGAGGGGCALVFFRRDCPAEAREAALAVLAGACASVRRVTLGGSGVRLEGADSGDSAAATEPD